MTYCWEPRIDWAGEQAQCLLEACDFSSLPIDPFEIIKWFGWEVFTVGCVAKQAKMPRNKVIDGVDSDLYYINGRYKIIYNEKAYPARIPFTLAHEIGHIWLNHLEDFELTKITQNSLAEEQYEVLEKEANCFAAELLMPYSILSKLQPLSELDLIIFCNVSQAAASHRLKVINKKMGWNCREEIKVY
jgi:Zn-dependent peptidase ImmA (M78 family)